MTKRYREMLDDVTLVAGGGEVADDTAGGDARGAPASFRWRGQDYRVLQILGHWREDPGWWRRPDGQPIRIEQTDLWRVEAGHGVGSGGTKSNGVPTQGVYELIRRNGEWILDRVWD